MLILLRNYVSVLFLHVYSKAKEFFSLMWKVWRHIAHREMLHGLAKTPCSGWLKFNLFSLWRGVQSWLDQRLWIPVLGRESYC